MRIIFLILIFFVAMTIPAQECEYTEYYPLVKAAADDYSDKNYKDADKKLKLAFTKTNFPHGEDLDLALKVAQKRKDAEWARDSNQISKRRSSVKIFRKTKNV